MREIYEMRKKAYKDKNLLVNNEMKEKIYSDFARYSHKLIYHMHYKEHISIPEEISLVSSIRKNKIIADLLTLPHISEIETLDRSRIFLPIYSIYPIYSE